MRHKMIFQLFLTLLLIFVTQPAAAQNGDAVLARVYANGQSALMRFSSGGSQKLMDTQLPSAVTSDGQWIAMFGYDQLTQRDKLQYQRIGQAAVDVPVDPGYSVLHAAFSADSRYLFYTNASIDQLQWILGIVDIQTGKRIEFIAPFSFDGSVPAAVGFEGIANAIHFDSASERLYVMAYRPFADGNFGGIYVFVIPELATAAAGRYPMPKAAEVVKGGSLISQILISSDGAKAAYLSFDPANPPQNFESMGPAFTFNTLIVLDLITGQTKKLAQAGPGQGLGEATWADSRIFFTGGNYGGSYFIAAPRLYAVDPVNAAVTEVAILESDPTMMIDGMVACGTTLYYATAKNSADGTRTVTLYSAPVSNPSQRAVVFTGQSVFLDKCMA
jgi:hypothetical protein